MPHLLTTPDELRDALATGRYADGGPVRVLDVRWRLDRPDGRPEYLEGHIPGAIYVDLDRQLAEHGEPGQGRHPLPREAVFAETVRDWGIDDGDTVVVYDDLKNLSSARAWWLLTYAGIADVRLLDGSLRAWTDAGLPLEAGEPEPPARGDAEVRFGARPLLDLEDVPAFVAARPLLDARAAERYRGDTEPIDPRAGHIPGALSAPTTENVGSDGRFLPAEELRARFAAAGVADGGQVGVYCGSGVTAAHQAVALTLAGWEPVVYAGSWSQWSNHPQLAAVTGDQPR